MINKIPIPKMKKKNYMYRINSDLSFDNINTSSNYYNKSRYLGNIYIHSKDNYYLKKYKLNNNTNNSNNINSSLIYKNNSPINKSIMSLYTESNINPSTNIIINLKNTLQLTERIKNKILTKNKSFNYKTFRPPKKINFPYIDDSQYYNNKKEKSFSNDNHAYDYNKNNGKIGKKDNNINIVKVKGKNKGKEKNKLNVIRNDLLEKNMKLRKENLILEKEINNYKEQFFSNKNLYDNKYYKNSLPKKVEYYKNKYHSSIDNNIKLLEQIFKIQEISQAIENNINKICSKDENIFKKVENKNR